jgi:hypothetical protein
MDARIGVAGGDGDEVAALAVWLGDEDELRGRVRVVHAPIGEGEMGSLPELVTVALASGGVGRVLAASLKTWLTTRRTSAKITVETEKRRVSLDIQTVDEVMPLLERILGADDADDDEA